MKKIISFFINIIFSIFKVNDKRIIFESGRDLIDGNAKAIYDYMKDNKIDNYELIWIVTKNTDVSGLNKNEYAYYNTLKGYYYISTSKYWIKNQSIKTILKKKKNQVYIQLFHGNGVMKKMGYDVTNDKERPRLEHTNDWDYYIANDDNEREVIKSSTGYNGNIKVLGMACTYNVRKDDEKRKIILNKLNITNTKKNILYAPTFRDYDLDKDKIDIPIDILSKFKDYNIIIRLHPLVRSKIDNSLFNYDNFINGCNYPDVSDILSITDILITDYSSIFYEYIHLNLPIIFYPYDYDNYVKLRGGFYINYKKELPGPICYNEEELSEIIDNIDIVIEEYEKKRQLFNKKYNSLSDGKACERFVNALINDEFK